MATIPSYITKVHGVLAYQPMVMELDHPWDGPGPYSATKTWPKLPEKFYCELIEGHIVLQDYAKEFGQGKIPYMETIPSFIEEVHGVLAYRPEVLELDHPWDAPGPYTYEETWPKLPEKFYCELYEGHIVMSPAALYDHQYLSGLLYRILSDIADKNNADAMQAPLDVKFANRVVQQPDLIYVENARRKQVVNGVMRGAPNLVIEIISPSHPSRDRKKKFKLYQKYGVPEYWLFNPRDQSQEFYVLVEGKYQLTESNTQGIYRSSVLPVLKINTKELWKKYLKRFPNP